MRIGAEPWHGRRQQRWRQLRLSRRRCEFDDERKFNEPAARSETTVRA
jgi:hypothetical protein